MAGKGKRFNRPKRNQVVFGRSLWPLIDFLEAICNGEIIPGKSYELLISDRKVIWKIQSNEATSGGNSSYRGEYSPDGITPLSPGPFTVGDEVKVSPTNANAVPMGGTIIPGFYVCILDAPSTSDLPNHPSSPGGLTVFWDCKSTYPSTSTACNSDGTSTDIAVDQQPINPP